MHEAHCVKSLLALLAASCLVISASAAGGEPMQARVTLSVEARPREEDAQRPRLEVWREAGVLSLRVVDPGRCSTNSRTLQRHLEGERSSSVQTS